MTRHAVLFSRDGGWRSTVPPLGVVSIDGHATHSASYARHTLSSLALSPSLRQVEMAQQCVAFLRGFRDLIPVEWVRMFNPSELQVRGHMMCCRLHDDMFGGVSRKENETKTPPCLTPPPSLPCSYKTAPPAPPGASRFERTNERTPLLDEVSCGVGVSCVIKQDHPTTMSHDIVVMSHRMNRPEFEFPLFVSNCRDEGRV